MSFSVRLLLVSLLLLPLAAMLVLLPLPLAAALVGGSALVLLALIDPIWALYAAVLAVPVQEVVLLPGGLNAVQAALLLATSTWALRICAHPTQRVQTGRLMPGLLLLVWALALASVFTPYSQTEAAKVTIRWASVVLVYALALNSIATGAGPYLRAAGLVVCLLLAPASNGLLGLWQFATGEGPPSFAIGDDFVRAYGTIGQPNSFAGYMNMAWPLALALALAAAWRLGCWRIWPRTASRPEAAGLLLPVLLVAGGAAGVLLAALLASFSRGGWVGAAGGAGAMLLAVSTLTERRVRARLWQAAGAAAAGVLALAIVGNIGLLPGALTQRVASITNNLRLFDVQTVEVSPANFAVVERMAQIQAAWAMFTDRPLTGVGPGNYGSAYEGTATLGPAPYLFEPWYTSRGHAHNYYLHIAAEAGLIGVLAYVLLLGLLAWQAWATLQAAHGWFWHGIAVGGCGIIAAVAVHNLFENLHVLNMGVQLGAVWGLLAAVESRLLYERRTLDGSLHREGETGLHPGGKQPDIA